MRLLLPLLLLLGCSDRTQKGPGTEPTDVDVDALLVAAGNAATEAERWQILEQVDAAVGPSDPLRADLDLLLPVIDLWANAPDHWVPGDQEMSGEGGYLGGYFALRVWPDGVGETYPPLVTDPRLRPMWCLYRGRMLVWETLQNGLLEDQAYADGRACLNEARDAYPDNPVIGMYLDEPIPWEEPADDAQAPAWANDLRVVLNKLDDVLTFWIDERQAPDGQLGGGWGDDVEVWRRFTPLVVGFDHPRGSEAFELLATGLWDLPRLEDGYTDIVTDVEHSAEDTGDTLTSMMLLRPGEAIWEDRADGLVNLSTSIWMGTSDRGLPMFQSTQLTSDAVGTGAPVACDTAYHARVTQSALLRWQNTGDPELEAFFAGWMASWAASAAAAENGKPAGMLPNALSWPTGMAGGPDGWLDPGCALNRDAYAYPRAMSSLMRTLVYTADQTGNPALFAPIETMADARRLALSDGEGAEGSPTWAASEAKGALADALAKHRIATGDPTFDDLLMADGDPVLRARLTGDFAPVEASLAESRLALSVDREAFTTEVRYTDRIVKFHSKYASRTADTHGLDLNTVYALVTGDAVDPMYVPLPAVRWGMSPRDVAVRVTVAEPDHLRADLWVFDAERSVEVDLLRPTSGVWTLSADGTTLDSGQVEDGVVLDLPPRTALVFEVRP